MNISEKKQNLYKKIEKLKFEMNLKSQLKAENHSLKEMQKMLMKRLEQQDEYFNRCMYGKQQEVEELQRRLYDSQTEINQLHLSLRLSQEETHRLRKFLQYYPNSSINEESRRPQTLSSIRETMEPIFLKHHVDQNPEKPALNLSKLKAAELQLIQDYTRSFIVPNMGSGQMNNSGNTYLDLSLTVNNIGTAKGSSQKS